MLASFLAYANQYTKPFNEISGVVTELQNAFACAGRLIGLIEEKEVDPDTEDKKVLKNIKGNIVLENVEFGYSKDKPLITDLSLNVKEGMRVAIVGPTGCGKTTLLSLMGGLDSPSNGQILYDGQDIEKTGLLPTEKNMLPLSSRATI